MMRADAGLHADQARRQVGKSRLDLATRPFLPKHDRTTKIVSHDVERVLANIDADHGDCAVALLRHGVLLVFVFAALGQLLSLAGREDGRAIPLPATSAALFGNVTHVSFLAYQSIRFSGKNGVSQGERSDMQRRDFIALVGGSAASWSSRD